MTKNTILHVYKTNSQFEKAKIEYDDVYRHIHININKIDKHLIKMNDKIFFALDLTHTFTGDIIDCVIKENVPSDEFLRFVLKYFNPKKNFISHIFLMQSDTLNFTISDCALNQYPDLLQRVKIADNALLFYKFYFNDNPIINFMSHSGHFNIKNKTATESFLLKTHFNEKGYEAYDYQLDTALSSSNRSKKGLPESNNANIIIANDINEGNSIVKSFMLTGNFKVCGFLIGTDIPVILNSRSHTDLEQQMAIDFIFKGERNENKGGTDL